MYDLQGVLQSRNAQSRIIRTSQRDRVEWTQVTVRLTDNPGVSA
jgi:hypothetical protein